jgi:xanthine dehydrogenase accessory factor
MAISGAGQIAGSVSGGCVEAAVVTEAIAAIRDGRPRLLTYGVSDNDAFAAGLACGGTIRVLVEPIGADFTENILQKIVTARFEQRPVAYTVHLTTWERGLSDGAGDPAILACLHADRAELATDGRLIVPHVAPLRLIVVGAVHIAQPLVDMARICGFEPTLIDPRATFGNARRFPGESILTDWPDQAISSLAPDARTAIVTLSHDEKLDDPAIITALSTPCFYVGCLGSVRTHAKRMERMRAAGLSDNQIARIHAPVGLDIGARSPAEIAVAIMAQIIHALRRR